MIMIMETKRTLLSQSSIHLLPHKKYMNFFFKPSEQPLSRVRIITFSLGYTENGVLAETILATGVKIDDLISVSVVSERLYST